MRLILTHEHADFDAIAALLGAALLDVNAFPVLPRLLNHNVRTFLNLYGEDLPFVNIQDLPPEPITSITLVDTQSLVTIKGMKRHSTIHVIDHHPLRLNLPQNWTAYTDLTGSCSTLLIERLAEQNIPIGLIPATLLLVGIYEDTGSLTYSSTTPRDLYAAAYLLEQGANINIATEYINQALSTSQMKLYDLLLASIESISIHSKNIVVTKAEASELTEEISSIAHKLRDLLDPDALFLLVQTQEGIRLITRSNTDKINVGDISAHFGGGGHDRAATALIKVNEKYPGLDAVYKELIRILPTFIQPSVKVSQIMSRQPMIISPHISVQDASQLMQRFGYEGYPVISEDKVVGLLTRRAVDRAISHQLNLTAASLMEAGNIFIHPDDSIENLQQLMGESGWGQIPVLSKRNGKIIGIVTRTDLLKALIGIEKVISGDHKLAGRLNNALTPGRKGLLQCIASVAMENHLAIYIVGGFVRDLLLNRPSLDFDLVVEGDAIYLGRELEKKFGGRIVSHREFGTTKWLIHEIKPVLVNSFNSQGSSQPDDLPASIDLISARTEFYKHPSALPSVERGSIKLDLHRRDFTINTLALRLDGKHYGELYDFWGGLNDLRNGIVRVLHSLSFVDDPTRILRAIRFEQRFGFRIDERTLQLIGEARSMLHHVSGQRLQHELNLMLLEEKPGEMFARMQELSLLQSIHSGLSWSNELTTTFTRIVNEPIDKKWEIPDRFSSFSSRQVLGYAIWFSQFPIELVNEINFKLRFPRSLDKIIRATCQLRMEAEKVINLSPSQACSYFEQYPLISIYSIFSIHPSQNVRDKFLLYNQEWRHVRPIISGKDLRERNISPGKVYQTILERLRSAWLDGEVKSREEENQLLEKLLG